MLRRVAAAASRANPAPTPSLMPPPPALHAVLANTALQRGASRQRAASIARPARSSLQLAPPATPAACSAARAPSATPHPASRATSATPAAINPRSEPQSARPASHASRGPISAGQARQCRPAPCAALAGTLTRTGRRRAGCATSEPLEMPAALLPV